MIVKINIPRLLGSSDDKEKIGAARPEGPPLRGFRYPVSGRGSRATYMGEKLLLLHDTYFRKKIPKSAIGINPIFGIHLVSCFQVIEFDPHYVNYKCIHLISDSNTIAHIKGELTL